LTVASLMNSRDAASRLEQPCAISYPQQRHLDLRVQGPRLAGSLDLPGHAAGEGPAGHLVGQRLGEPAVLQRLRPQRLDRAAGLGQAVPGQPLGVVDPPLAFGVAGGLLGRLELGDDAGGGRRAGMWTVSRARAA